MKQLEGISLQEAERLRTEIAGHIIKNNPKHDGAIITATLKRGSSKMGDRRSFYSTRKSGNTNV